MLARAASCLALVTPCVLIGALIFASACDGDLTAPSGSTPDAALESGVQRDASSVEDADADPPDPCSGKAFCDDFDDGTFQKPWDDYRSSGDALSELVTDDVRSAPNALRITTTDPDASSPFAELSKFVQMGPTKTTSSFEFDAKIDRSKGMTAFAALTGLRTLMVTTDSKLLVFDLEDGGGVTVTQPFAKPLPSGAWFRIRLVLAPSEGKGRVYVDGELVADVTMTFPAANVQCRLLVAFGEATV